MKHHQPDDRRITELQSLPLFEGLSRAALIRVDALLEHAEVPAGRVMVREGSFDPQLIIIVSGVASVVAQGCTLAMLGAGDFFGEMSMLDHAARSATVTAVTDMRVLAADARSFLALIDIESVARTLMRTLVERLRVADGALLEVARADPELRRSGWFETFLQQSTKPRG